jgi:hypothetical protein
MALSEELKEQMKHDAFRADAIKCTKILEKLKELDDGHVWSTKWRVLVDTAWRRIDGELVKIMQPSDIGEIFLNGLKK